MIPLGANALIAKRLEGWRPHRDVWVLYGKFREPGSERDGSPMACTDWAHWLETRGLPEMLIKPQDPIERIDLRCIAGLRIVFFPLEWTDAAARLYERLQDYASEISVMSPAFDEDIGWLWRRDVGQTNLCGNV